MNQPNRLMRLLPITLLGLSAFTLPAKQITPEESLHRLSTAPAAPSLLRAHTPKARLVKSITTDLSANALYLFDLTDRPGYFVMSADDCLPPLLGYSESGTLADDDLPDGLQWWLNMMADEASVAIQAEDNEGVKLPPSLGPAIEPLVKARWGQTEPYNTYTPIISENQSPTGCVATALTQIMYYHQWPLSPKGSITYQDSSTPKNTYSMTFDGIDFKWDLMTDTYDDESSEESKEAVATLMKAVGFGVKMNYGKSSSGATDANANEGMINYFGYSKDAQMLRRESFTRNEWDSMLYSMLSAGLPIYYTGRDAVWLGSGGHAFVCDGYDGNGYFHYNWGWNDKYNGYFLTTCLVPAGAGTGGFINGYNYTQSVMANLHPDNSSEFSLYEYVRGSKFSLSLANDQVAATLEHGPVTNNDSFQTGICITSPDSEDALYYVLGSATAGAGKWTLPADLLESLDKTVNYDLRLVWRNDENSEWKRILPLAEGLLVYNPCVMGGHLTYNDDQWQFAAASVDYNPIPLVISDITINDNGCYISGKENTFTYTITNTDNDYEFHAARCYAVDETGAETLFFNTSIEMNPSETRKIKYTIKDTKTFPKGEYTLRFINVNSEKEIPCDKTYQMTVYEFDDILSFDDGTFVYSIIPGQPAILTGTVSGEKATGDILIPAEVTHEGETYPIGSIQLSWSNLLDNANVTSLRIEYPLTKIAKNAFSSFTNLTEVHIPECVREIEDYAFAYNKLMQKVTLPSRLDAWGARAFYNCYALEEISLPLCEVIPEYSFYHCQSLNKIVVPEGVREIGRSAFYYCDVLEYLELPSTLETLGLYAFTSYSIDATKLVIKVNAVTPPQIESSSFASSTYKNATLKIPGGTRSLYAADPNWSKFIHMEEFTGPMGVDTIDSMPEEIQWFTIDGQILSATPTQPGIYLKSTAGKKTEKIIIR